MSFVKTLFKILLDLLEVIVIATGVFIVIYFFAGRLLEVTGDSMSPNFQDKEQLIAEKVSVNFNPLKRGEVVILRHPLENDRLLIKRVIGLPGETIQLLNGFVYINESPLDESYLAPGTVTNEQNFLQDAVKNQIPDNSYVVMGDNRARSTDSREWGYVRKDLIIGRAFVVFYPLDKFRIIENGVF